MRILLVTHRFGSDVVGGPERHLWNLAEQMARMGSWVDVVTTRTLDIEPYGRFGERWSNPSSQKYDEISLKGTQHPIQVYRFPVQNLSGMMQHILQRRIQRRWEKEENAMLPEVAFDLEFTQRTPLLLTGWHQPEQSKEGRLQRWTTRRASIQIPPVTDGSIHLQGYAPKKTSIHITVEGESRVIFRGKGPFELSTRLSNSDDARIVLLEFSKTTHPFFNETRRLGVRMEQVSVSSGGNIAHAPFHVDHRALRSRNKEKFIEDYSRRAESRPGIYSFMFDLTRGPICPGLTQFVRQRAHMYDWIIGGPVPFSTLSKLQKIHRRKQFRFAAIPLFHVDDDYHYWKHYLEILRDVDVNLANSRFSNEAFFPSIGAKSFIAGAGVDDFAFRRSTVSGDRFRQKFGFGPDEKIVLSVGRKTGSKLYRTLAKAVHNIQHRMKCRMVLIGPDEDHRAISYPSCSYLGVLSQEDLIDAYDACDVFALMSESESFGITFIEAWMRAKPVIGNRNCGPVAQLIHHGENGLLAARREDLEDHIVHLLKNPEEGRKYGEAGLQQALRNHTWKVIARRVLDYLEAGKNSK